MAPSKANNKPLSKPNGTTTPRSQNTVNLPDIQNVSLADSDNSSADNSLRDALHFKPLPLPDYQQPESARSAITSPNQTPSGGGGNENNPVEPQQPAEPATQLKGISLREYEAQRRMVEEQNRHKKQLIYKAIEQRYHLSYNYDIDKRLYWLHV